LATDRQNQNSAIAYMNRGLALSRADKHDEALVEYRKALQYAPADVLILTNVGWELAEAGDLGAGINQLQSVVNENLNTDSVPFALLQLGRLLQKKGNWQRASDQFRKATELRPSYEDAHRYLAYALAHEGRRSDALLEYTKVARLSPRELVRRYSQVFATQWLGNALRDQGKYAAAAATYRESIRLEPDYGMARCDLGAVLEEQGHRTEATQQYRAALMAVRSKVFDSTEWLVVAHQRLGEALIREGRAHDAEGIAELRKAIELDSKRLESYFALGKALYVKGNFVEAAAVYEEAIKVNPQSAAAHNILGLTLDKQGLVEQAVLECRSALNLEPDNAGYHANLVHELALQHSNGETSGRQNARLTLADVDGRNGFSKQSRPDQSASDADRRLTSHSANAIREHRRRKYKAVLT